MRIRYLCNVDKRHRTMKKHKITEQDYLKAHRKAGREEEIARHGRPVGIRRAAYNCSGRVPGVFSGAGRTVTMLSTTNFVNPRQGSAPKYSL